MRTKRTFASRWVARKDARDNAYLAFLAGFASCFALMLIFLWEAGVR